MTCLYLPENTSVRIDCHYSAFSTQKMQPGTVRRNCRNRLALCICWRRGHDFSSGKKVLNARRGSYADSHDAPSLAQFRRASLPQQQLLWRLLTPLPSLLSFLNFNQLRPCSLRILNVVRRLLSYNFTGLERVSVDSLHQEKRQDE